jgi:hypothetical protein
MSVNVKREKTRYLNVIKEYKARIKKVCAKKSIEKSLSISRKELKQLMLPTSLLCKSNCHVEYKTSYHNRQRIKSFNRNNGFKSLFNNIVNFVELANVVLNSSYDSIHAFIAINHSILRAYIASINLNIFELVIDMDKLDNLLHVKFYSVFHGMLGKPISIEYKKDYDQYYLLFQKNDSKLLLSIDRINISLFAIQQFAKIKVNNQFSASKKYTVVVDYFDSWITNNNTTTTMDKVADTSSILQDKLDRLYHTQLCFNDTKDYNDYKSLMSLRLDHYKISFKDIHQKAISKLCYSNIKLDYPNFKVTNLV